MTLYPCLAGWEDGLFRYHNTNSMEPDVIVAWAREIAEEWRWLFASASLPALTPETFNATVLEDESNLWLVLFTDGMNSLCI